MEDATDRTEVGLRAGRPGKGRKSPDKADEIQEAVLQSQVVRPGPGQPQPLNSVVQKSAVQDAKSTAPFSPAMVWNDQHMFPVGHLSHVRLQ